MPDHSASLADPFIVRPAVLWEAAEIFEVYQKAFEQLEGRIDPPTSAKSQTVESLSKSFGRVGIAVCVLGETIVGCVFFKPDGNGLYLYRLAVSPFHQGKGVAKRLIAHVVDQARVEGREFVALNVRIPLVDNQRLFQSAGFREVSRHCHEGYDEETFIRMEYSL
ncbi:GNAT family N-acetyltransferase [Aestuariispira insulae]|uniref:Acetyltransferase (GNAT) family protein n=1 Tax=Aestuariispira insulae TaxID=1461337 RepID=A0A3D9HXT7_9PROT|nr:GNAT family N-acetyltransferase [Aestuariispira insulae]RED54225.1 acetyltransferase (GNAT) family protein [Aestuariispira insulae]